MVSLQVSSTNNNPAVIAGYFLDAVNVWGAPKFLRTDFGTENGTMAAIQSLIHNSEQAHIYGSSTSNQRIEALWSKMKPSLIEWQRYFQTLVHNQSFCLGDDFQTYCLRFAFAPLVEKTVNNFLAYWNSHHVRESSETPGGAPDVLFYSSPNSYLISPSADCINEATGFVSKPSVTGNDDFDSYFDYLLRNNNMNVANNKQEALNVYNMLQHSAH